MNKYDDIINLPHHESKYYKRMSLKINVTEVIKSYNDPYVYHLITKSKPWRSIPSKDGQVCFEPMIRFYEMARKTIYFHKILEIFPNMIKVFE